MRNVNLASYGVEELSEVQMREVNGGCGICRAIDAAAAILKSIFCKD